jgi:hypothetical protein
VISKQVFKGKVKGFKYQAKMDQELMVCNVGFFFHAKETQPSSKTEVFCYTALVSSAYKAFLSFTRSRAMTWYTHLFRALKFSTCTSILEYSSLERKHISKERVCKDFEEF